MSSGGSILYVNLESGRTSREQLDAATVRKFLGGYGVNVKLAAELLGPGTEALSPDNLILVGAGPFAGTLIPGAGKTVVTTRFPLNGAVATAAGGGRFAFMLKSNGFDNLVITGKSKKPVYLKISGGSAEICDASGLWGKDAFETDDSLRKLLEPCGIIAMGQAGERLSNISLAHVDKGGTLGSGGLGAVMGSKNLKAIVGVMGNSATPVAHPLNFMKLVNELHDRIMAWPGRAPLIKSGMRPDQVGRRGLIYKNWTEVKPCRFSAADFQAMGDTHRQSRHPFACACCPLGEKEVIDFQGARYCMTHFPDKCFNSATLDEEFVRLSRLADVTNRYGLCQHNLFNAISLAIFLYQNEFISKAETGGLELKEDYDTYLKLTELTASRRGFGDWLADGALAMARRVGKGAEKYVVHSKGRSPIQDARLEGVGTFHVDHMVAPRGCHASTGGSPSYSPGRTITDFARHGERMGMPAEAVKRIVSSSEVNFGRYARYSEDWYALFDSLSLCNRAWVNRFYHIDTIRDLYQAVTGVEAGNEELMKAAERTWNLEKMINVKAGFSRKDDTVPVAWLWPLKAPDTVYVTKDYFQTREVREADWQGFLDEYYRERGWDVATGIPTGQKLQELDI